MTKSLSLSLLGGLMAIWGCQTASPDAPSLEEQADQLAHKFIIADGHVDLPYRMRVRNFRLEKEYLDVSKRTEGGDFDFVRAQEGGLDAPFMSIYIPAKHQETPGRSAEVADSLIDLVEGVAERYPEQFAVATSPAEVQEAFAAGKVALPMGMENGSPLESIELVQHFYDRGVRYVTLTHSKDNLICDSSYDTTRTHNGLSAYGEEVVKEMNRVGIMVDISHVSDSAFFDVLAMTDVPMIASHSSCRYFTPGFERNMNDDMLKALAEKDGVIMINFGSTFIDSTSQQFYNSMRAEMADWMRENKVQWGDSAYDAKVEEYKETHGGGFSSVHVVADHIQHVVEVAGIDHVGFGSDFDGVGDTLPTGLKDVADYPNLIAELLRRGFTPEDIEKIASGNLFRVWNAVQAASAGA
ncbi:dipeptidase [Pontibacter sp. G13]|uniref:dipeptidase n=1 Tax=Pontibacter sp. G13 TaxID=3074898 RepID=UPI00288A83DE|nr:dipeptidase [Pontibacter sp. G13]WNJ17583.1 dipeptidase [Pontibacter sp. G13]